LCNLHESGIFDRLSSMLKNMHYRLPIDGITVTRAP
jgi:hypothetical protein